MEVEKKTYTILLNAPIRLLGLDNYVGVFIFLSLTYLLILSNPVYAQTPPRQDANISEILDDMVQDSDEEIDFTDLFDRLTQYQQNPINLNAADREELGALYILSDNQITALLNHIKKNGPLLTAYELQAVPEFDVETIQRLLVFTHVTDAGINVGSGSLLKRIWDEDNKWLLFRYQSVLEPQKGYLREDSSGFLGNSAKLYGRALISHRNDFSLGFTTETDPGEQFIWDPDTKRYGMDYYTAHLQLYNKGKFKAIALGDYNLSFGQGLVVYSGFSIGKGAETITTARKSQLGIKPYNSVLESQFFRGGAFTYGLGRVDITMFYSHNNKDGLLIKLQDTLESEDSFVTSFQETGFHRTYSELGKKHTLKETVYGGNLSYLSKSKAFHYGLTYANTAYGVELNKNLAPYNQFSFVGNTNFTIGTDFFYNWRNLNFFGELAQSPDNALGYIGGVVASLSNELELALLHRSYDRNFRSFFSAGFAESSRPVNETGTYWGIKITPKKSWVISSYFDIFSFPWLKFQTDAPSGGHEFLTRVFHKRNKHSSIYVQFKNETKGRNSKISPDELDIITNVDRKSYRLQFNYKLPGFNDNNVSFASRVEFNEFVHPGLQTTYGYVLYQDLKFNIRRASITARYALFDTDNFDNRIYTYENNVLYMFSTPMLNGTGSRAYIIYRQKLFKKLDFWLRYGVFDYENKYSVGSGTSESEGGIRSEIIAQVKYNF